MAVTSPWLWLNDLVLPPLANAWAMSSRVYVNAPFGVIQEAVAVFLITYVSIIECLLRPSVIPHPLHHVTNLSFIFVSKIVNFLNL